MKKGLKLLWVGIGKDDFLLSTSRSTVELLKQHGYIAVSRESEGGHTWINWRNYLSEFAPQLCQTKTRFGGKRIFAIVAGFKIRLLSSIG